MIIEIDKIRNNGKYTQLSLFQKVKNDLLYEKLDQHLYEIISNDVLEFEKKGTNLNNNVIEVIHPSKIDLFYEADKYLVKVPYKKDSEDFIFDRKKIYIKTIESVFNTITDTNDIDFIIKKLKRIKILSFINEKENVHTAESFFNHITGEITFEGAKYFRIDKTWYYLEDSFIERLNNEAKDLYERFELKKNFLNPWNENINEDKYNKSHTNENSFVFDKKILDNIELCDIMFMEENNIFFVHVKNGFSANMRDLSLQVKLAAKRLINDIKNINGSSYLKKTIEKYNTNSEKKIDVDILIEKIKNNEYSLNFVFAYNNNNIRFAGKKAIEKIELSQSNIAKYCLINTIKEINNYTDVNIWIKDISII